MHVSHDPLGFLFRKARPISYVLWGLVMLCATLPVCLAQDAGTKKPGKVSGKQKSDNKGQPTVKLSPASLAKNEQVVATFKKIAESAPTVLSGKIEKSMTLRGLVVIEKDATLASDAVELVPSSGAVVVNNAVNVWYKPVKIKGVPFASIATNPQADQRSHMYTADRFLDSTFENCVFKGKFLIDPNVTPSFSSCLFLASPLPGCGEHCGISGGISTPCVKGKFANCLFQGINFNIGTSVSGKKVDSLYLLIDIIARTDACGFKDISFLKPNGPPPKWSAAFPDNGVYPFYDFDNTIVPAIHEHKAFYKGAPQLNFTTLNPATNTIPYLEKVDEIGSLLDALALKHLDPALKSQ